MLIVLNFLENNNKNKTFFNINATSPISRKKQE